MVIENNPRPDNIPKRPRLTAEALSSLMVHPDAGPSRKAAAANWLDEMRSWHSWAMSYCKRLDAMHVDHQAISHDRRVEPGALADAGPGMLGNDCKICAYLNEQYEASQIQEPP